MTTLSERISWLMQHFKLSQSELGRIAGIKQPSVASWISGRTKNMKSGPALAICSKLPINQEWLVNGEGQPLRSENQQEDSVHISTEPFKGHMKKIPILSYVEAGNPSGVGQIQSRQNAIDNGDFIWVDGEMPDSCFALRVVGLSMEPEFKAGDILVIDPTIVPAPGDFVVASRICRVSNEQETTFKKYRPRGYDEHGREVFELIPLNEDYPKYESRKEELTITGVLVEHRRSYRRRR